MANVSRKAASSVELTDSLQAGFGAAMERVEELNLDPCATLVDAISIAEWASWDACEENALVVDRDTSTLDGVDEDFDVAA